MNGWMDAFFFQYMNLPLSGDVILSLLISKCQGRVFPGATKLNGRQREEGNIGQYNDGHGTVQV